MAIEFSVTKLRNGHGPALIFVNGFLNGTENDFTEWLEPTVSRFPHNPCYGVRCEYGCCTASRRHAQALPLATLELPGCPVLANVDATPWVEGHRGYKKGLRVALGGLPEGARLVRSLKPITRYRSTAWQKKRH